MGFSEADLTVREDAGIISVPVTVKQDIAGLIAVNFAVVSESATEGTMGGQLLLLQLLLVVLCFDRGPVKLCVFLDMLIPVLWCDNKLAS